MCEVSVGKLEAGQPVLREQKYVNLQGSINFVIVIIIIMKANLKHLYNYNAVFVFLSNSLFRVQKKVSNSEMVKFCFQYNCNPPTHPLFCRLRCHLLKLPER